MENGVSIGDYFEAELGSGTTFPVFVPELDNAGLPHKFYLPIIRNGEGTATPPPVNPGNGFYFTHPIRPNQSAITWRMYYTAGQRVAMRISHGPTTSPYPAPGATQDEVYYLLGDHLGSTTVTINSDGSVKAKVRYDAWGKTRSSSGTTPTDRKYTGQIEEATVGLYFYNARWYDPALGRFIQADTIIPQPGSPLAWDRYAYARSNPINYNDLDGHCPLFVTAAVGAVVGFAVDAGFQIVPQLWNEASITEVDYHWQQGLSAAVAGAVAGGTLGIGTILAASVESGVAATVITGTAGGIGNMIGNQVGTLIQSAYETGAPMLSTTSTELAANYGYLDPVKAGYDFTSGAITGAIAQQINIRGIRANSPKMIDYQLELTSKGTKIQAVSKPILNGLGNPLTQPNFQTSVGKSAFYEGITSFSNYAQTLITTGIDTAAKWIRQHAQ